MNEAAFKKKLCDDIRLRGSYARRIEDQFSVGMPDMLICVGGFVMLAEAKIIRASTWGPTPRQFEELRRFREAGGHSVVIGWNPQMLHIDIRTPRDDKNPKPFNGNEVHLRGLSYPGVIEGLRTYLEEYTRGR